MFFIFHVLLQENMISQASFFWSSQLEIAFRSCSLCRQSVEKPKVIIPCGHIVCSKCSGRRTWCPNCSRSIIEVRHEYKSLEFITKVAERLRNPTTSLFQNFPPSGDDANEIELPDPIDSEPVTNAPKEHPEEFDTGEGDLADKKRAKGKRKKHKKPNPDKSVGGLCPAESSAYRVNSSELEWNGKCNTIQSIEGVDSSANSNNVLNNSRRKVDEVIKSSEVENESVKTKKKQTKKGNSEKKKEESEPFSKSLELRMLQTRLNELKDCSVNKLDIAGCSKFVDGLSRKRYYHKKYDGELKPTRRNGEVRSYRLRKKSEVNSNNAENSVSVVSSGRKTRSNRSFETIKHSKTICLRSDRKATESHDSSSPEENNRESESVSCLPKQIISPKRKVIYKEISDSFSIECTDTQKESDVFKNLRGEETQTDDLEEVPIKLEDEELGPWNGFRGFETSPILSERDHYILEEYSVLKSNISDVEKDKAVGELAVYDHTDTISIRSLGSCSTVAVSDAETEPDPSLDTAEVEHVGDHKQNVIVDNPTEEMVVNGGTGEVGSTQPAVEEEYDCMLYTPGPKCKKRFLRRTSSELAEPSPKRAKVYEDKDFQGFSETDIFTQSVKVLLFKMKLASHPLLKDDDSLLKSSSFIFGDKQLQMRNIMDTSFSSSGVQTEDKTPTATPGIRAISPVTSTERRRANVSALMDQSSLEVPSSTPLDWGRSSTSSRRKLTFTSSITKSNNKQPVRRTLIKIPDNTELCIIQDDSSCSFEELETTATTTNSDGDHREMSNNGNELRVPRDVGVAEGRVPVREVLDDPADNDVQIVGVYDGDKKLTNGRPGSLNRGHLRKQPSQPADNTDKRAKMRTKDDQQPKEGSICTNAISGRGSNEQVACFSPASQNADNHGRQSGRLSFATCCLTEEQMTRVGQLARFSRSELHKDFSHETTHLVIGSDGVKTVEYHLAIAYRAYIVTMAWVDECISRNRILPTSGYIPTENGGPSRSLEPVPPPFVGISICPKIGNSFDAEYPLFEIIKTLCSLGGATLVTDVSDFGKSSENHTLPFPRLFIYNLESQLSQAALEECRRYRAIPVHHKWVFDSISAYTTLPLKNYLGFEETSSVLIKQYKIPSSLAMSPSKFRLPKSRRMRHHSLLPKKSRRDSAFLKKLRKGIRRKN